MITHTPDRRRVVDDAYHTYPDAEPRLPKTTRQELQSVAEGFRTSPALSAADTARVSLTMQDRAFTAAGDGVQSGVQMERN
jgi:hypothetical protein